MDLIDDKLIIAKLMDKIKICKTRNKIVNTEFLSMYQKEIIQKELNKLKIKNYLFFGGYEGAEAEILVIYPEKYDLEIVRKNLENILKVIKIELPKEVFGKYTHRDYLGMSMKAGLNRNRIGDINVSEKGAYIFVLEENAGYIVDSLKDFTRLAKAKIEVINYTEARLKEQEFEEIRVSVQSMRIDSIVSELIKTSRNKTNELLLGEKVFVNTKCETKPSKLLKENDILAIRGSGKFIVCECIGNNKKGKMIVEMKKYK